MKKFLMSAMAVFMSSGVFAQSIPSSLENLSKESAAASRSSDLGTAYGMASRSIDGSLLSEGAPAVQMGDIAPSAQEDIEFSQPGEKIPPAVPGVKDTGEEVSGPRTFGDYMGEAMISPIVVPVLGMLSAGKKFGETIYEKTENPALTLIGAIVGAVLGFVGGILSAPFAMASNIYKGFKTLGSKK